MGLFEDKQNATVDGRPVRVVGKTGPVHSSWTLFEADEVLDEKKADSSPITLTGTLSTGTPVSAEVAQGTFGPTTVRISANGETVAEFDGFVA
ncbi:hypothetical protein [Enemella evansiae]|uniref:hypothetical protein n=1 Tax=Enemella evansiae TaxID=2016499 RepID=UPI000B96814F|nr:hypothetical protein [Enemella evansiae]OYN99128.1 hypothetical protein CGZ96_07755 [Enemella evansiae]OYO05218.1 hypothetical protein CGZ97_00185 [Enemella evansiae]OYO15640.1 hypothetical protein CGZ98_04435 [Enemella evansiae]PFG67336.1 hypothetical protein B0O41_2151 [Propionibacteriaceae bacterium ES.041]